jgi:hypothetical protein
MLPLMIGLGAPVFAVIAYALLQPSAGSLGSSVERIDWDWFACPD